MDEANITINGQTLSTGQSMAVRVAINDFIASLADPKSLGDDEHGRAMTTAYRLRLSEVLRIMYQRS